MGWIALDLPIPPSANHHHAVMRGRVVLTKAARAYREEVWALVMQQTTPEQREALPKRLIVSIVVHPSCKTDTDNLVKEIYDSVIPALGVRNDWDVWNLQVTRSEHAAPGRVSVQIGGEG